MWLPTVRLKIKLNTGSKRPRNVLIEGNDILHQTLNSDNMMGRTHHSAVMRSALKLCHRAGRLSLQASSGSEEH